MTDSLVDRTYEHGPFDIIGDIHGCFDELVSLLEKLGYQIECTTDGTGYGFKVVLPHTRKLIFLGDLVDRGPKVTAVLRLAIGMVSRGEALCVPGNHDAKLMRKLRGRNVRIAHGLAETLEQLSKEPEEFHPVVAEFFEGLAGHYVLDDGKLVVAHAGMKEELQGNASSVAREFALYGEVTGTTDEYGLPIRGNWAADYQGTALVVYGHTPVPEVVWQNNAVCIDTGCVFGGKLTALRYPELELVSVPAAHTYCQSAKPIVANGETLPPPYV